MGSACRVKMRVIVGLTPAMGSVKEFHMTRLLGGRADMTSTTTTTTTATATTSTTTATTTTTTTTTTATTTTTTTNTTPTTTTTTTPAAATTTTATTALRLLRRPRLWLQNFYHLIFLRRLIIRLCCKHKSTST